MEDAPGRREAEQSTLAPHCLMLVVAILMTAEYGRLVTTIDQPQYGSFVCAGWVGVSLFLILQMVCSRR